MRVFIKEQGGHTIRLRIPTRLVFNSLTARIAPKVLQERGFCLTSAQLAAFFRTINTCRKHHRGWKLAEVHSADGDVVEITL